MSYILVGLGGAFGAMGRFGIGQLIMRFGLTGWPYATLAVNIIGSFIMGLVIALLARHTPEWSNSARLLLATGFCGGFTTFSAFSLDFISLYERGQTMSALLYVGLSVVLSIAALFAAMTLVRGSAI
ncbi:fluoride efflux transporter CrcB [Maritalea mediterranea]|uniref:Fluoride-specific ion channel FluC n=1 Tax=Maritalea mediterranea TaxID=2909667 RepID=A0ABS9E790_9HYPH|nr:fluoride efflux transporter CrcB [Maritalea mediterranea]MCF4098653.1 fluoride efflux transporter CrcB [Maritalea mediterranea]